MPTVRVGDTRIIIFETCDRRSASTVAYERVGVTHASHVRSGVAAEGDILRHWVTARDERTDQISGLRSSNLVSCNHQGNGAVRVKAAAFVRGTQSFSGRSVHDYSSQVLRDAVFERGSAREGSVHTDVVPANECS